MIQLPYAWPYSPQPRKCRSSEQDHAVAEAGASARYARRP
jgi:hypothetical protein